MSPGLLIFFFLLRNVWIPSNIFFLDFSMLTRYLVFFNKNRREKSNFNFFLLKTGYDHVNIEGQKKQKQKH